MASAPKIRRATREDLAAIAKVHTEAFPDFFLTRLGPSFLRTYYRLILNIDGGILLVAVAVAVAGKGSQVVGFAAGFVDPEHFYAAVRSRRLRFGLALLPAICRRPGLVPEIVLASGRQAATTGGSASVELSSVAVRSSAAGSGVGRLLVRAFARHAQGIGAPTVHLTTDAVDNERVRRFYEHLGFSVSRRFTTKTGRLMMEYGVELDDGFFGDSAK